MFVKNYMNTDVVTVTKDVKITEAIDTFESNNFHQMPVVDENGKYIGLITEGIISKNSPSNATSLSIYEMNYLLGKVTVGELMLDDADTISANTTIDQAAKFLLDKDRSVLTVVDDDNNIEGIITDKDIFKALIEITGGNDSGARVYVKVVENRVGVLEEVTDVFAENNISITKIFVDGSAAHPDGIVVQITDADPKQALDVLEAQGYIAEVLKH